VPARGVKQPEVTRGLLLRAGSAVLEDHYLHPSAETISLPIKVGDVLSRVPEVRRDSEPLSLTTGAVVTSFGNKPKFMQELSRHYISAPELLSALAAQVELLRNAPDDPEALRRRLAIADFRNMVDSPAQSRHWFMTHAHAANPELAAELRAVYEAFDDKLGEIYAEFGRREDVQPIAAISGWQDVALALTAWVEGQALRYLSDPAIQQSRPWIVEGDNPLGIVADGADALWKGLTAARRRKSSDDLPTDS
jgi:AcrR family transcriptional regulator